LLTSINIPQNLTTIGVWTFSACSSLVSIAVPPSGTEIDDEEDFPAFLECHVLQQRQINHCNYHQHSPTWLQQRFDDLPLHQSCSNDASSSNNTITLNHTLQQYTSMITVTDAMLMTPLHILCCNPAATDEMIQLLKADQPYATSMRNAMNKIELKLMICVKNLELL
jgi:hypothetical protein